MLSEISPGRNSTKAEFGKTAKGKRKKSVKNSKKRVERHIRTQGRADVCPGRLHQLPGRLITRHHATGMGTFRAAKTGAADFVIPLAECRLRASLADLEFVWSAGCDFSDGRVGMSESVTPPDSLSERAEAAMCRVVQSPAHRHARRSVAG